MANFLKGINFGKGTGSDIEQGTPGIDVTGQSSTGPENPGAQWNEKWNTPDYTDPDITYSRYDKPYTSLESSIGDDRLSNMSEYRQDKIENRSNVLAERGLNKLQSQEDKIKAVQGGDLTKRQLKLLGKGKSEKAMKIANRKAKKNKNKK